MAEHLIKVFGERNTGTRAVLTMLRGVRGVVVGAGTGGEAPLLDPVQAAQAEQLRATIEAQFRPPWRGIYLEAVRDMECVARGQLGAWKHSLPTYEPAFAQAGVHVLFMVRDPYSWALSMFRKPYHRKGPRADTVAGFIDQPWMTERRDYMPCVLESPMDLWNAKLTAYLDFCEAARADGLAPQIIRFEDFIADPATILSDALSGFGIPARGVEAVEISTKNEAQRLPALQDYYRREAWIAHIPREAAERISARTDWELAGALGYQQRDLETFPHEALGNDPQRTPSVSRADTSSWTRIKRVSKARLQSIGRALQAVSRHRHLFPK